MKNILKLIVVAALLVTGIMSCSKDENKIYYYGGNPPVLTSSTNAPALSYVNADKTAFQLTWTNPNYRFSTGISSQDVSYLVEIDTAGANFTNPQKQTVSVSKDLSISFTVSQFNDYLLNQLVLKPGQPHAIEIRVKSNLAANSASYISNTVSFTVTPYAIPPKVPVPTTSKLYLVGSATPGGDAHGWDNPVPTPSQQFTQLSPTLYEITIPLIGGKEYLFLPLNGDWGNKYAVADNTVAGLSDGGDFGFNLSKNFPGPAASGTYKITVDFQRGKFTVTKQ